MTVRPTGCGEDVAPYALGALDAEEARRFERHLDECELCRADLATLRPVVDALPATAEPVEPPPELRKRIMSVVEAEAKERRRGERAPAERPWWRARFLPAVAAAAAAAVIVTVVVTGGDDDARSIRATVNPPGAQAELRMEDGRGTLVVEGMPPAPAGRVYQVWKQRAGGPPQPTDALFTPTSGGAASVAVPGTMDGVEQVLVSTEPPGGSRRPTTAARIVIRT